MRISDWSSDVCSSDLCIWIDLVDQVLEGAGVEMLIHPIDGAAQPPQDPPELHNVRVRGLGRHQNSKSIVLTRCSLPCVWQPAQPNRFHLVGVDDDAKRAPFPESRPKCLDGEASGRASVNL